MCKKFREVYSDRGVEQISLTECEVDRGVTVAAPSHLDLPGQ